MKEHAVETALREAAHAHGGLCWKITARKGAPDRLLMLPGRRAAFVELKAPRGIPTELQRKVMTSLERLGFPCYVVDSPTEARRLVQDLAASGTDGM